jgi:hypothetical protein
MTKETNYIYTLRKDYSQIVSIRKLEIPTNNFHPGFTQRFHERTYMFGSKGNSINDPFMVVCLDSVGNMIWSKSYPGKRGFVSNVVEVDSGKFLVAGCLIKEPTSDTTYGWYLGMDTSGVIEWEKIMDGTMNTVFKADFVYAGYSAGHYYISGGNGPTYPSLVRDSAYAFVAEIEVNGDIRWRNNFLFTDSTKHCLSKEVKVYHGSLYATVYHETSEGVEHYRNYLTLVKLDNHGNLIWKRLFRQWNQLNIQEELNIISDGFLILGFAIDSNKLSGIGYQDAWIIHTDTNGCILPGCELRDNIIEIADPDNIFKVYPNPCSDVLTIAFMDDKVNPKGVFIYDMEGRKTMELLIKTETTMITLNTTELKSGSYYVVIQLKDGSQATKKVMIEK